MSEDDPNEDPENNALFRRKFCLQEMRWAIGYPPPGRGHGGIARNANIEARVIAEPHLPFHLGGLFGRMGLPPAICICCLLLLPRRRQGRSEGRVVVSTLLQREPNVNRLHE